MPDAWYLGTDIGGTFTDVVLISPDGRMTIRKVPSMAEDYGRGIIQATTDLLKEAGLEWNHLAAIMHGTTIATNAILERKGARTALLTTRGFRDALEIRRLRMPRLYDLDWDKPPPLVERHLRFEIPERLDRDGNVIHPLVEANVQDVLDQVLEAKVESVAICFLHSYRNSAHEQQVAMWAQARCPAWDITISSDILPEVREYERTSTTVINAYVSPVVRRYLRGLRSALAERGSRAPLWVMQSNGGLLSARVAAERPIHIIESGPAAGVVGTHAVTARQGWQNAIALDMGGTTAKASLIEEGRFSVAAEYEVGGSVSETSRIVRGGGYALRVPAIDIAEVGAGGGSIVWVDSGGVLRAGPRSAGAVPGPVAYNQGGIEPTITDANLLLGYLNPHALAGGSLPLDIERARASFQARIAEPLGLTIEEAAYGARVVANSNMVRAVRSVTTERGRDPRDYLLFAYGGSGPAHAVAVAEEMDIERVVIPPAAGVFSALGLCAATVQQHYVRSMLRHLDEVSPERLEAEWTRLEAQAIEAMQTDGFASSDIVLERIADLRYVGQSNELMVPAARPMTVEGMRALVEAFGAEHRRTYGHEAPGESVEAVTLRVVASRRQGAFMETTRLFHYRAPTLRTGSGHPAIVRRAYWGPSVGWLDTPVYRERESVASGMTGPFIIEEYDATTIVPPNAAVMVDRLGNLIITLSHEKVERGASPHAEAN